MGPAARRTKLYLIRHGEVAPEWRGRVYGSLDVPLSPTGEAEARAAAARLAGTRLAHVVSSGLARAEYGASALRASRDLPRRDDPDLRELDRGHWAGRLIEELARSDPGAWEAWHRDPVRTRSPGGESLGDVQARVLPRLQAWAAAFPGEAVAIVTHSWVIRTALSQAFEHPLQRSAEYVVETGSIAAFAWPVAPSGGAPELLSPPERFLRGTPDPD